MSNRVEGDGGFDLALPFDTDDPEFVRGVEVGQVWEVLKTGEPFARTIHATNAEMVLRMAEAMEREVGSEELGNGWIEVSFR